ncbi:MAG: hypothetical protein ACQESR_11680 [Planctomycetota bacterium]
MARGARITNIRQAVGFVRVESCSTQAVLRWVGLAGDKIHPRRV